MNDKNKLFSFFIRFWFTAKMAAHGILSKPLRSSLTILGVAIGVASVVSLMGIGEGARLAVIQQFESLGSNVITIEAHDASVEFDPEESQELLSRVNGLEKISPIVSTKTIMKWKRARGSVKILGVNEEFPDIRDHNVVSGHFFSNLHVKQRAPVAVLGYNMGKGLLNGRSPVGRSIYLNGESYRIIGVLEQKGSGNADNIDDKIIIPYTAAQKIAEKRTVEAMWGKAKSEKMADLVVVQLGRIFKRKLGIDQSAPTQNPDTNEQNNQKEVTAEGKPPSNTNSSSLKNNAPQIPNAGEDVITITSLNKLVEEADKANRVMTLLLGGIAAVSLLVGGLGIMNIMLVAVTERTEEIGVRRALGAKQGDLLLQFILEALYLSIIGAIAGIVSGIWGMNIFARYGFETAINFQSIKIASIVAITSGLLFGVYPAISASSVPPVEALRRQ